MGPERGRESVPVLHGGPGQGRQTRPLKRPRQIGVLVAAELIQAHGESKVIRIIQGSLQSGGTYWQRRESAYTFSGIRQCWDDLIAMDAAGQLR